MKLKELTQKIGSGATPTGGKNTYLGGDISLIRSQNVLDFEFCTDGLAYINDQQASKLANVEVRADDVLLNITGDSVARCCRATKDVLPARVNQHVSIIRPKEGISSSYLMYWLLFMKSHLLNICKIGGTRNAITKEMLEEMDIDYPTNASALIKPLETIDAKIAVNKTLICELEETARLIYDYWFTQFDFPDENGNPYRSSGGKMVWNDQLKREIPEGWRVADLGNYIRIVRGVTYDAGDAHEEYENDRFPLYRANNIVNGMIKPDGVIYVDKKRVNSDQLLTKASIFMCMSSGSKEHVGKTAVVPFSGDIAFGAFCAKIEAEKDYLAYLDMFIRSNYFDASIKQRSLGTNINNVTAEMIQTIPVAIPPIHLSTRFNSVLKPFFNEYDMLSREIEELISLRDWLLPMLVNGQAVVGE